MSKPLAVFGMVALTVASKAVVIGFEDVDTGGNGVADLTGFYKGFVWEHTGVVDTTVLTIEGFQKNKTGDKVAFNSNGALRFSIQSGVFDLKGFQIAPLWVDSANYKVRGTRLDATKVWDQLSTVAVQGNVTSFYPTHTMWSDLVSVEVEGIYTLEEDLLKNDFVFDNFDVDIRSVPAVPEPFSMGLAALGLGVALKRRRR